MLEAIGLSKTFGETRALDSLDLEIGPGEVFCLLGSNGAGKTTTINLFLNFVTPTAGVARINGQDVTRYPLETKRALAYLPEQVMLYQNLSGLENLGYFADLSGQTRLTQNQLRGYLHDAGLPEAAVDRRVSTYSKGMRQKVGIAVALAKKATVLLLDEPTSGLDPKAANEFSLLLKSMSEAGTAVLMATHDLFRAKESGTRIGIMKHGRLVETRATASLGHADLERIYLEHMKD